MDGCKIIAISGIDGNFSDFINYIEPNLDCKINLKISYDRSLTFRQNIQVMRSIIDKSDQKCCLVGWSIGAVAVAFLSDCLNVASTIMINPFFCRSEILKKRNILCDEEVCIFSTSKQNVKYIIIAGKMDDKIPYSESLRIMEHYNLNPNALVLIDEAKHGLSTFPNGTISEIINNVIK